MKYLISVVLTLAALSPLAQMFLEFHYENGKYGFSLDPSWKKDKTFLIPVEYDTIFEAGNSSSKQFLAAVKNGETSYFWYESAASEKIIHPIDTLGINFIYTQPKGTWDNDLIGTNPLGEKYIFNEQFEKASNANISIVRNSDKRLYLSKNGKKINEHDFQQVEIENNYIICKNERGFWFFSFDGKLVLNDPVDSYQMDYNTPNYYTIYKNNLRGHLDTKGSLSLPLSDINTPDRLWHSNADQSGWNYAPPIYMSVGEKNKMGLIDSKGNEVWPRTSENIIVAFSGLTPCILKKNKKKWELYSDELELTSTLDFDEFIGSDDEIAIVLYGDRLVTLDVFTGDTSELDFTRQYEAYRIIVSPEDKVGVINQEGELFIPCNYTDVYNRIEADEIIVLKYEQNWTVLNLEGDIIYENNFDEIWPFEYTENAFVCRKGNLWSVFSLDGNAGFGPTQLFNAQSQFNIDAVAHSKLADYYVFKKNNKCGIMDNSGKIIHEPSYDYIFTDSRSEKNMFLGMEKNQYTVFQSDMKSFQKVNHPYFIDFSMDLGFVFANEEQIICIDPTNLKEVSYKQKSTYSVVEIRPYNFFYENPLEGACDSTGKIIVPIKYRNVIPEISGNENPYIKVIDTAGNQALFSASGEQILDFSNLMINDFCVRFDNLLFIVNNDGTRKIVTWHADTKSFVTLAEKVSKVSCVAHKKLDHIAEIEFEDHTKKLLYPDMSIK